MVKVGEEPLDDELQAYAPDDEVIFYLLGKQDLQFVVYLTIYVVVALQVVLDVDQVCHEVLLDVGPGLIVEN